jgi:hypothetical protein
MAEFAEGGRRNSEMNECKLAGKVSPRRSKKALSWSGATKRGQRKTKAGYCSGQSFPSVFKFTICRNGEPTGEVAILDLRALDNDRSWPQFRNLRLYVSHLSSPPSYENLSALLTEAL